MRPVFHIGYHKTASTFLQKSLFDSDPRFLRADRRSIFEQIIYPNPLVFDHDRASNFVNTAISQARDAGQVPVFSNERLSGGLHTGGHDCLEIMSRIRRIAPDSRILICVREQSSMIRSLYAQYVKAFGVVTLRDYCYGQYTKHNKELFHLSCLEYHRLVSAYFDSFGKKNVTVLPFEQLVQDKEQFLKDVYQSCGAEFEGRGESKSIAEVPRNIRQSAIKTRFLRVSGPFRHGSIPNIGSTYCLPGFSWLMNGIAWTLGQLPLSSLNRILTAHEESMVAEIVANRYSDSNRKLEALTGLDLSSLGYPL